MSYKTDRLVDLFPDAYAAREADSLLYKVLDAFGAELMAADEKIKQLLKSHWVRFAEGSALDALGGIYGLERRTLRSGQRESDQEFRRRLQATVPLFTGGGTRRAVLGAVRSALGLPFNLDQLRLPPQFQALREDIEKLVVLREFSPTGDRVLSSAVTTVALDARTNVSELVLAVNATTVSEGLPRIDWTFEQGGRRLSVERLDSGQGFRSRDPFVVPPGRTLVLSAGLDGRLSAVLDGMEVGDSFVNLNGTSPALLPPVPTTASEWRFRAQSALYDVGTFDGSDSFDLPRFQVALSRLRLQPLTFDVEVPYFLQEAVADLKARHHFTGELLIFEGIPLEYLQEVVDQTRAAGVRGSVHFSLTLTTETHNQEERFTASSVHVLTEDAQARDALLAANTNEQSESHDTSDRLTIAGVFDISPFDGPFGFL